ncbi:TonB-dependent receptor [Lutimonas vermicola]|uniref:TonB-dependent receptor n=1 Tax=Lutimonas vermicola TaxID=414288 RepID=A0ABU9L3H4_9FLAO
MTKYILILIFLMISGSVFSQKKKKERITTEEINVVKPFSPTVSEAFKINAEPQIDSIDLGEKKEISYTINSIPVASTFTPAKGKAKTLSREPKERFYNNYVSLGYGNYKTPIIEIFAHGNSSNYNDFGGFFNYHSSGGGIDGIVLNDDFKDLNVDLYYKQSERTFDWKVEGELKYLSNNWYGLSEDIAYSETVINSIEERQSYTDLSLGGEIEFFDALIHKGDVSISRFSDKYKSGENHLQLNSVIDFPIGQELMYSEISLELLNGKFENDFFQTQKLKYTYFNIGFSPNFEVLRDNLTLNAGAKFYYSITNNFEGSKFYIYPNVTASYNISEEALIAYAGVIGDLQQNSYKNFVDKNPFVSPTLYIQRTNQQYNAYAGIKGLLNSKVRFNLKAAYINEKDKPLYKLNPSLTDGSVELDKGYEAANSFQVVYDDVNTIYFNGEIIFDLFKEFKFGGNLDFNSYSLKNEDQAWNLPLLKATLLAKYTRKKWSAGADLFFSTDRKDELSIIPDTNTRITNAAYFDINLNGVYTIDDKFDVFINVNNLLGTNYQVYTNYKVQGLQFFGGVKYKFDF